MSYVCLILGLCSRIIKVFHEKKFVIFDTYNSKAQGQIQRDRIFQNGCVVVYGTIEIVIN